VEGSQRQLNVPSRSGVVTVEQYWKEDTARGYLDWIAAARFSLNLALQWDRFVRNPTAVNDQNYADLDLLRMPLELRYSDPSGLFGLLRTSLVRETGHFRSTATGKLFGGDETFGVVDAGIGWRFPGRAMVGMLQVKN